MNFENIKVEGDINFNDELFKAIVEDSDDEDNSSNKKCLISLEPLNKYAIKLDCGHTFNYKPLYNEIVKQKTDHRNRRLSRNFKCPYCRNINTHLIPYLPEVGNDIKCIIGVNYPAKATFTLFTCEHRFKSGKRKGECCGRGTNNFSKLCNQHNKKKKITSSHTQTNSVLCSAILVSGKRKGEMCNCGKIFKENLCLRHYKKQFETST